MAVVFALALVEPLYVNLMPLTPVGPMIFALNFTGSVKEDAVISPPKPWPPTGLDGVQGSDLVAIAVQDDLPT